MVQWLRLQVPKAGGFNSIPGWETRFHILQLKIPHAPVKTWGSQINKYFLKKKEMVVDRSLRAHEGGFLVLRP